MPVSVMDNVPAAFVELEAARSATDGKRISKQDTLVMARRAESKSATICQVTGLSSYRIAGGLASSRPIGAQNSGALVRRKKRDVAGEGYVRPRHEPLSDQFSTVPHRFGTD